MTATTEHHDAAEHVHEHPTDLQYVKIALLLGVLTALEVGTYFWEDLFGSVPSTTALILTLFPMMIAKFAIVAGYFMHLKFDSPLFTRMFVAGLSFAVVVYAVMLTAFRFWE